MNKFSCAVYVSVLVGCFLLFGRVKALAGDQCDMNPKVLKSQDGKPLTPAEHPYELNFEDFETPEGGWPDEGEVIDGSRKIGEQLTTREAIAFFQARLATEESSKDFANRTVMGELLLRLAKEEDDLAAYAESEAVLRVALSHNKRYRPARMALAKTLMSRHNFVEALQLAEGLHEERPHRASTIAMLFDCHLELGHYQIAQKCLDKLQSMETSAPVFARAARMHELHCQYLDALTSIDAALQDLQQSSTDFEHEAIWYRWRKATLLHKIGRRSEALGLLKLALKFEPTNEATLVALAELQFSEGDVRSAIETLELCVDSAGPPTLALLGDLYESAGSHAQAKLMWARTEALIREESKLAKVAHSREASRFFADHNLHGNEAVVLAKLDVKQRPDPFAWDSLAWAYFKSDQINAAKMAAERALKLHNQAPSIRLHAALILAAAGEHSRASNLASGIQDSSLAKSISYHDDFQELQSVMSR